MPLSSCNGYELAFPRTLQSTLEEQICLVATVRLVTPQFLKVTYTQTPWFTCTSINVHKSVLTYCLHPSLRQRKDRLIVCVCVLKDLCNVEDVCDEFTSRHSLEWKFLFLDHRWVKYCFIMQTTRLMLWFCMVFYATLIYVHLNHDSFWLCHLFDSFISCWPTYIC